MTRPRSSMLSVGPSASVASWRWAGLLLGAALLVMSGCGRDSTNATPPEKPTDADSIARYQAAPGPNAPAVTPVVAPAQPAPKPTGPLPPDATCVSSRCHVDFATAPHVHGPVSAQGCSACHQPDTGNHHYPLKRSGNAVCTFCHTVSGNKTHVHKAVDDPGCLACHNPHVAQAKYLLKYSTIRQVCADCHQMPLRQYAHQPFADGQCTVCHLPHEADNPALLRGGAGRKHCLSCHKDTATQLARAGTVHRPVESDCLTCHNPHSSNQPHELKAPMTELCLACHKPLAEQLAQVTHRHGALDSKDACVRCHNPHASNRNALLARREDQLCLTCHDQPITTDTGRTIASMAIKLARKYLHGPLVEGECAGCHDPHGADRDNLLVAAFPKTFYTSFEVDKYDLCFQCHNKSLVQDEHTTQLTDFRDGALNLHYVHVHRTPKGRTCKTCHAVHASDLPNHMARSVPFENSNWRMALGYEPTADGGRCSPGCHEPKTYRRDRPVTGSASSKNKRGA